MGHAASPLKVSQQPDPLCSHTPNMIHPPVSLFKTCLVGPRLTGTSPAWAIAVPAPSLLMPPCAPCSLSLVQQPEEAC